MLKYLEPLDWLPTAEDLPDCDSTPVDSELQEFIPTFLKTLLIDIWADRSDWFFGIDMGIYYVQQAEAQVQQAEARSQRLADRLRALGIDPDEA